MSSVQQEPAQVIPTQTICVDVSFIVNCSFDVDMPVDTTYKQAKKLAEEAWNALSTDEYIELVVHGATDFDFEPNIEDPEEDDEDETDPESVEV